jgi:deazaflavin-dependent oxidoreductase (nitroreductase family)
MATFTSEVMDAAAREREVVLTTYGRRSGDPHRVVIWVWGDGQRLFMRSGGGLGRDWPRNLLATPRGVLQIGGLEVPFASRHLDPAEARTLHPLINAKYGTEFVATADDETPTPAEQATFEILPR